MKIKLINILLILAIVLSFSFIGCDDTEKTDRVSFGFMGSDFILDELVPVVGGVPQCKDNPYKVPISYFENETLNETLVIGATKNLCSATQNSKKTVFLILITGIDFIKEYDSKGNQTGIKFTGPIPGTYNARILLWDFNKDLWYTSESNISVTLTKLGNDPNGRIEGTFQGTLNLNGGPSDAQKITNGYFEVGHLAGFKSPEIMLE